MANQVVNKWMRVDDDRDEQDKPMGDQSGGAERPKPRSRSNRPVRMGGPKLACRLNTEYICRTQATKFRYRPCFIVSGPP